MTAEYLTERIKALARQYGEYPVDVPTWLNGCRWKDQVATPANDFASRVAAVEAEIAKRGLQ